MWNKVTKRTGYLATALLTCASISFQSYAQQVKTNPIQLKQSILNKKANAKSYTVQDQVIEETPLPTAGTKSCATDAVMSRYILQNNLQAVYAQEKLRKQNTSGEPNNDRTIRTVPVVFHVVYNPNKSASVAMNNAITAAVIDSAVARLNADYSKTSTTGVRSAFQSLIANTNIQFCLANRDPNGLTTTGITRTTTTQSYFDSNSSSSTNGENAMKTSANGIVGWDHLKYVNIWLCDITDDLNLCSSGCTAGYAYLGATSQSSLPNTQGGIMIDGIVLDYKIGLFEYPGSLPNNLTISHAISHEMGHYFGLDHTFMDNTNSCTNDDGFSDTPKIKGPFQNFYSSCSSATTVQSCTSGTLWQYENLMDYSDCFIMFTTMQSNYMNDVLTNGRYGLLNSQATACVSSGPTAPVASFTGCSSHVLENATVSFTSTSTNSPTSWSWAFSPSSGVTYVGGTSSGSANPQVQFSNTGTYSVTLTVSNTAGTDSTTSASCVVVVAQGTSVCDTISNMLVTDTVTYYTSGGEFISGMNAYGDKAKAEKYLSSSYSLGNGVVGVYLYFGKFAGANSASNVNVGVWDASGSGGSPGASALGTQNLLLSSIPSSGPSEGFVYVPFSTPVSVSGDFFAGVVFSDPYVTGDTVVLLTNLLNHSTDPGTAWEMWNDDTWHTLADGWNYAFAFAVTPVLCPMTTSAEREKAGDIDNVSIYPNPSNGQVSIMVGLNKSSDVKMEVYNGVGQLVQSSKLDMGTGGKVDFDLSGNKAGVYFVKIQTQSSVVTKRVILNR